MPRKSAPKRSNAPKRAAKKSAASRVTGKAAGKSRLGRVKRPSRNPQPQRLQRLLAAAGLGSRRQCEELIEAGRVDVDGVIVTKLGTTVDPATSKIRVDGVILKKQKLVYYAVNKPVGFVTTNRDPQGRPRVIDLVPPDERVFAVGRLDRSSEGLILLTNDGELAQKLTHPKFGVRKVYRATVAGKVDLETMKQMRKGIYLAEGFVRVEGAKLLKSRSRSTEMEIVLREGKNREIRRILSRLGHKVQQLRRIAVGPLRLGDMPSGAYRVLSHQEIDRLWRTAETAAADESAPRPRTRPSGGRKKLTQKQTTRRKAVKGRARVTAPSASGPIQPWNQPHDGTIIGAPSSADADDQSTAETRRSRSSSRSRSTGKERGGRKVTKRSSQKRRQDKSPSSTKMGRKRSSAVGRKRASVKRNTKPNRSARKRKR